MEKDWENFDFAPYDSKWKYFAVDEDGAGWLFVDRPTIIKGGKINCFSYNGLCDEYKPNRFKAVGLFDPTNWENSLQQRPK